MQQNFFVLPWIRMSQLFYFKFLWIIIVVCNNIFAVEAPQLELVLQTPHNSYTMMMNIRMPSYQVSCIHPLIYIVCFTQLSIPNCFKSKQSSIQKRFAKINQNQFLSVPSVSKSTIVSDFLLFFRLSLNHTPPHKHKIFHSKEPISLD